MGNDLAGHDWKLLVVEDDPEQAYTMQRLLARRLHADIDTARDLAEARTALSSSTYDAVVTDYQLPDGSGLELLREIALEHNHPPVILVTGQGDEEVAAEAFRLQASGYVVKDDRLPDMIPRVVSRALGEVSLRRAEEALLLNQKNQRALLDATPEALLLVDMQGRILTINETGARRLGHAPDEMVGKVLMDYLDPELATSREQQFQRVAQTLEPVRFEDERNGVVLSNVLYPVTGRGGRVERVAVFSRDITRQKANEKALREAREELEERVLERTEQLHRANLDLKAEIEERKRAEEALRALTERVQEQARVLDQVLSAGPQHFFLFDEKGKFIYASKPAADLLGRDQSEFSGRYWWELGFPKDVMSALDIERENVRRTARPWKGRMRFPTPHGVRYFEYALSPVVHGEGNVDTVVAAARDVTEEKEALEELVARTASLQERSDLLDLTHETIIVRDSGGRIVLWNSGAEETWGWSSEEALGRQQFELLKTEFEIPPDELEDILLQDGRWEGGLVHTSRDGTALNVASRQVVHWSEGRQAYSVLEIDLDVSDRRAREAALERKMAAAEHLERALDLLPTPVFIVDVDGIVTLWNGAAEKVFGWRAEEAIGVSADELLQTSYSVPAADAERELVSAGTWEGDLVHIARGGGHVRGRARRAVERDEQGRPAAVIEVFC